MKLCTLGDIQVSTLIEREGPQRKTAELFPTADRERALEHFREMEAFLYQPASDRIYNTYQSFLLRLPGRTVLIDTCVGDNKARPPQFSAYPKKPWLDAFSCRRAVVRRHRSRDLHPPACRSRRLEHQAGRRPLAAHVSESPSTSSATSNASTGKRR